MMRRILLILFIVFTTAISAFAQVNVHYKGYVDFSEGIIIPGGDIITRNTELSLGLSTSHGIQLFNSLFVGGGIEVSGTQYGSGHSDYYGKREWGVLGVGFIDVRYLFRKDHRVQPFVGTRIGGGYQSIGELSCLYFSPSGGISFNIREKFGLDLSIAYKMYHSTEHENYYYKTDWNYLYNGITLSFGIHF